MSKHLEFTLDEINRLRDVVIDVNENMPSIMQSRNSLTKIKHKVREIRKSYEEVMEQIK